MTNQKHAADVLERLAELEARENERQRIATEQKAAQQKLEEMRPPSSRRITASGEGVGQIQCITEDCPELYIKHPVELTYTETTLFLKDPQGNATDYPESSWTHWNLKNDAEANCPSCKLPRNTLPPGSRYYWEGGRKNPPSELDNLRKLRNAEIQRVEIVQSKEVE